jgi:hypothetical protein
MPTEEEKPDLKRLCSQVFMGVGHMHSEDIISAQRTLLYSEAVRELRAAGVEGDVFKAEMATLEILIEDHLSKDRPKEGDERKSRPDDDIKKPDRKANTGRIWTDFKDDYGSHYIGQILNGKPDGEGTLIRSDGHVYTGGWRNGEYHGHGKHTRKDGTTIEGHHVDGHVDGYAVETLANGSEYKGEWKYSQRHGQGVFRKKSGAVFAGVFSHGSFKPERSGFAKVKKASVYVCLAFLGLTAYQAWANNLSFLGLLDEKRAQLMTAVGFGDEKQDANLRDTDLSEDETKQSLNKATASSKKAIIKPVTTAIQAKPRVTTQAKSIKKKAKKKFIKPTRSTAVCYTWHEQMIGPILESRLDDLNSSYKLANRLAWEMAEENKNMAFFNVEQRIFSSIPYKFDTRHNEGWVDAWVTVTRRDWYDGRTECVEGEFEFGTLEALVEHFVRYTNQRIKDAPRNKVESNWHPRMELYVR